MSAKCNNKSLKAKVAIGRTKKGVFDDGPSPYTEFVTWISGTGREHPVEIFTTNYDLLFEQALERTRKLAKKVKNSL